MAQTYADIVGKQFSYQSTAKLTITKPRTTRANQKLPKIVQTEKSILKKEYGVDPYKIKPNINKQNLEIESELDFAAIVNVLESQMNQKLENERNKNVLSNNLADLTSKFYELFLISKKLTNYYDIEQIGKAKVVKIKKSFYEQLRLEKNSKEEILLKEHLNNFCQNEKTIISILDKLISLKKDRNFYSHLDLSPIFRKDDLVSELKDLKSQSILNEIDKIEYFKENKFTKQMLNQVTDFMIKKIQELDN